MNRKLLIGLIVLVVVLIAGAGGYFYYQKLKKAAQSDAIQNAGNFADDLSKNAAQGVLPSIDPKSNPMENAPDTNPVSKTNPFTNIKTNPFK